MEIENNLAEVANDLPKRIAGTDVAGLPVIHSPREAGAPTLQPSDPDTPWVDPKFASADEALTHAAGVMVFTCYGPDPLGRCWPWRVWADHKQGCLFIKMDYLMGAADHIVIPIRHLTNEGDLYRHVLQQCGNLLERFNLPRGPFDAVRFFEAVNSIPAHRRYYGAIPT
jgi:hypothetical protein